MTCLTVMVGGDSVEFEVDFRGGGNCIKLTHTNTMRTSSGLASFYFYLGGGGGGGGKAN